MSSTRRRKRTALAIATAAIAIGSTLGPAVADGTSELPAEGGSQVGSLYSWGLDGEFGTSNVPADLDDIVAMDTASYTGAALRKDGTVVAWETGYSEWDFPGWAEGLTDVVDITVGGAHMIAHHADGSLSAHGSDRYGQSTIPESLRSRIDIVAVEASDSHNVALLNDGTVVAWGQDSDGEATVPEGLTDVVAISANSHFTLALRADGTVVGWGWERYGQATPPADLDDAVAIEAGLDHSVAIRADGTVVAWGHENLVTVPAGLDNVVAVAADGHTLALRADGTVVAWGGSQHFSWGGRTSVPNGLHSVIDIDVDGMYNFVIVEAGADSPLPDTTPPEIRDKGTITKAATSAKGARVWFTPEIVDAVFADAQGWCSNDQTRGPWYPLGTSIVDCWARDWAGNESRTSYEVRITWSWSGLHMPTGPGGQEISFDVGEPVSTWFKLTKGSHGAADANATLWWAPVVDGDVGEYVQARDAMAGASEYTFDGWKYELEWDTSVVEEPGTYSLKVDLGDGVERTTLVELIT